MSLASPTENGGTFCNDLCYWAQTWYAGTPGRQPLWDWIAVWSDFWFGHQGAICENTKSAISALIMVTAGWYFYARYSLGQHILYPPRFLFDLDFKVTEVKIGRWHRQLKMVARFVTTNATELKLGTQVPLGDSYSETELRSDLITGLATRGRYVKTQKVLYLP